MTTNEKNLLSACKAAMFALNAVPNTRLSNGTFPNTYAVAAYVGQIIKDIETPPTDEERKAREMSEIGLTRVGNDVSGNPRFACKYYAVLSTEEEETPNTLARRGEPSAHYALAIRKANRIGGRKYHTKKFGGGLVFTEYESVLREKIWQLRNGMGML